MDIEGDQCEKPPQSSPGAGRSGDKPPDKHGASIGPLSLSRREGLRPCA